MSEPAGCTLLGSMAAPTVLPQFPIEARDKAERAD
jgi:hypothetical protein